jgi:two-component system, NarL family, invasion response regulator UvrY
VNKSRVLIVDDHAVVRRGLCAILNDTPDFVVACEAADKAETLSHLRSESFDVVLLDLSLGRDSGLDLLPSIKKLCPTLPVLVLTAFGEDQFAIQAIKAGAHGFLSKQSAPAELVTALRRVLTGKKYVSLDLGVRLAQTVGRPDALPHERLSEREFRIFIGLVEGKRLTTIAVELNLSAKTVTSYRTRALEKMGMNSNAEAVRYALQHGLIQIDFER